jgi:hypothetical protein
MPSPITTNTTSDLAADATGDLPAANSAKLAFLSLALSGFDTTLANQSGESTITIFSDELLHQAGMVSWEVSERALIIRAVEMLATVQAGDVASSSILHRVTEVMYELKAMMKDLEVEAVTVVTPTTPAK